MALKENYKDDILDTSQNVKRKYQMENNGDGTVSFTDVTEYTQQGDSFGASDMNATNSKVNALETDIGEINDNLTDGIGGTSDKFRFGTDGDGNYGYIKKVEGADTFFPFSKIANFIQIIDSETTSYTITQNDVDNYKQLIIIAQTSTGGGKTINVTASNVDISFSSYNSHSQTTSGVGVFVRNNLVVGDTITVNKGNGMYLKLMVLGVKY